LHGASGASAPPEAASGGAAQADAPAKAPQPAPRAPSPARGDAWWTAFADPALDAAIQEALRQNYTIRDLRTLIYENQLDPTTPRGWLWPLQVEVPGQLQRSTAANPPTVGQLGGTSSYSQADIGISASYRLDVWGQLDLQRRLSDDLVEQQRQNTEAFAQSLAQQVTEVWFQILEQRALAQLLERQVRYNQELLQIVSARFEQQLATRLAVLQQEQQLLDTRTQVPLVQARLALLHSQLTALLGRTPTPDGDLVPADRRLPELPAAPPVGAPVDLLRNSPELRLAHSRVLEVEHQVSQNLASWLPSIDVLGSVGVQSFDFSEEYLTSAVGVRLTWPLFDGARRITEAKQLELRLQRRNWQYELALKTAVQRVQEALIQERTQAESTLAIRAQVELGQRVLEEARRFFEQGRSDYLPVLTALSNLSNLERASIQSQRLLLSYRAQLYRSLGGAWSEAATHDSDGRTD
jgi:outer membrane protein TolC